MSAMTPIAVVGDDAWAAAAASALTAAGHPVIHVGDAPSATRAGAHCVVCGPEHVAALAAPRSRPAIVALVPGDSCTVAVAALDRGADECVDQDAGPDSLWRAAALAVARRAAAARARRDPLTGSADRALLHECLASAMASIPDGPGALAVLFVDLDGFKAVNDRYGHHTGDRVLVHAARRLQAAVRPNDLVARYGGDEFVVVCEHVDPAEARVIARRLSRRLGDPVGLDGLRIPLGASVGVAITRDPSLSPVRVIALADADMYRVKEARRPVVAEVA